MNEYYDFHHEPDTMESNVEFVQLGAIPKTPLHQTIVSFHRPPLTSKTNTSEDGNKPQNKNVTEKYKTQTENHKHTISHAAQDHSDVVVNAARDHLDVVMQRQNDVAELVVSQQNLSLLPASEISVFDGNPSAYQSFIHAFEHLI